MRPLRFSINVTLDGCVDHEAGVPDEELHMHVTRDVEQAGALLFGRVTYEMMEAAWREPGETGAAPEWMDEWMMPWARAIHAARKYVVSDTLEEVDWNAELIRGDDLERTVRTLKEELGDAIFAGGVTLGRTLADLGLIDEYQFIVQPMLAGHGPKLFDGLAQHIRLKLVGREEFASGAVVLRFEPAA